MRFETQLDTVVIAILIAGLLPLICAAIAKWGDKTYDNHNPRVMVVVSFISPLGNSSTDQG